MYRGGMVDETLRGQLFFFYFFFSKLRGGISEDITFKVPEFPRLILRVERKVGEIEMSGELPVCKCGASSICGGRRK